MRSPGLWIAGTIAAATSAVVIPISHAARTPASNEEEPRSGSRKLPRMSARAAALLTHSLPPSIIAERSGLLRKSRRDGQRKFRRGREQRSPA